jgi:hypothetical protein
VIAKKERNESQKMHFFQRLSIKTGLVAVLALGAALTACEVGGPEKQDIEDWIFKDRPVDDSGINGVVIDSYTCHVMEHGQAHSCDVTLHYTYKEGAGPKSPVSVQRTIGFNKMAGRWNRTFNQPTKDAKDAPK